MYLAGSTDSFGANAFIVKLAVADGSAVWQKTYGIGNDTGLDIVVDGGGNLLLTGGTDVAGTFGLYLTKITSLGDILWQRSYVAQSGVDPRGGLAVGADGSAVVAAAVFDAAFGLDAGVIKFDPNGNLDWDRVWGGASGDEPESVAVGADGSVFLAGSTASFGVAPDDAFLVKFLANGRAKDAATWGGAGLDKGHDVAVAPDGHILISGTAEAPPYQFLGATTRALRLRGTVGIPTGVMTDVTGNLADPGGVVATPNGSLTYAGGFDAALLKIAP